MKREKIENRVWKILERAWFSKENYIILRGQRIKTPDGYVPGWVFCSIPHCGSTEGKRLLRRGANLRDTKEQYYHFEKKRINHSWHYRIRPRDPGTIFESIARRQK